MVCIDANIWIYYFDSTLPEHESVAKTVDSLDAEEPLFVTSVLQMEVIHYLANQHPHSQQIIERFLDLDEVTTVPLTTEDVRHGSKIIHEYANSAIGGRDASVLAAMDRCEVDTVWTHDTALQTVAADLGFTVLDPVEEA